MSFGRGRRARSRLPPRSVLLLRRGVHRTPTSRLPPRSVLLLRRGVHRTPAPHDTLRVPRFRAFYTLSKIKTDTFRYPFLFWQGQKGSNPRHAVLETAALPTELYPYIYFGGPSGTRTPDQPVMSRLL